LCNQLSQSGRLQTFFRNLPEPPGNRRKTHVWRLCRNRKEAVKIAMPLKTGIQNILKILDPPVSSTRQAQSRTSLAWNDKKVITTQSPGEGRLEAGGGGIFTLTFV
jgi:hypothetical protein